MNTTITLQVADNDMVIQPRSAGSVTTGTLVRLSDSGKTVLERWLSRSCLFCPAYQSQFSRTCPSVPCSAPALAFGGSDAPLHDTEATPAWGGGRRIGRRSRCANERGTAKGILRLFQCCAPTLEGTRSRLLPTIRTRLTVAGTPSSAMAVRRERAAGARARGHSWQITPRVLTEALAAGGDEAMRIRGMTRREGAVLCWRALRLWKGHVAPSPCFLNQ